MTYETARCPICRYDVCPRSHNASIIEFSKCVRRHQVTKLFGFPCQPFRSKKGVTVSVSPFCISTMVPYWSNVSTLVSRLRTSDVSVMFRSHRMKVAQFLACPLGVSCVDFSASAPRRLMPRMQPKKQTFVRLGMLALGQT